MLKRYSLLIDEKWGLFFSEAEGGRFTDFDAANARIKELEAKLARAEKVIAAAKYEYEEHQEELPRGNAYTEGGRVYCGCNLCCALREYEKGEG